MNRYELGKRVPAIELVQKIADVLRLPLSFFYAARDDEARLLVAFHCLDMEGRAKLLAAAETVAREAKKARVQ
jgi:transcriptional regulator with XRE-family HTH domain